MLDEGEAQSPSRLRGEGCVQILEDVSDDADLLEPVKEHARVDHALADQERSRRSWMTCRGRKNFETHYVLLPICFEELQHAAGQELELQSFRPTSRMDLFTLGNDFLDGRIAVLSLHRKGKQYDVLLDSQVCNQLVSSWFFGVVGSAVGKNGSHEGKLCWMHETLTIFERKGLRVHVDGGECHRSPRSGVGAVTQVADIAKTICFLDRQCMSILSKIVEVQCCFLHINKWCSLQGV